MIGVRRRRGGSGAEAGRQAGGVAAGVIVSVTAQKQNRHDLLNLATFSLTAEGTVTQQITEVGGMPWTGGTGGVVHNLTTAERLSFCSGRDLGRSRGFLADLAAWYGWTVVA